VASFPSNSCSLSAFFSLRLLKVWFFSIALLEGDTIAAAIPFMA